MVSAEVLSRLLLKLYAAPNRPELWPEFLVEFTGLLGLPGAAILYHDMKNEQYGLHTGTGVDPEAQLLYQQHYGKMDPWRPRFLKKKEGELAFGDELCPPEELRKTEFYNDLLLKFDARLFCGIATLKEPDRIEEISLYQRWQDKPPGKETLDLLNLILPHLQSALRLRRNVQQLHSENHDLEHSLDALPTGIALIGEDGQCVFVNKMARELLDRSHGLAFKNSRISAIQPAESTRLQSLIDGAVRTGRGQGGSHGGAMLITAPKGNKLHVAVHPFRSGGSVFAIAILSDPNRAPASAPQLMQALYGLTAAESVVANQVSQGRTPAEIAECNQVSQETVRSQMKAVFAKTGVRRQSELVRLMGALPALRADSL